MAFNHVTVDPVVIYSAHNYTGSAQQTATATTANRLVEHAYSMTATGAQQATYDMSGVWSLAISDLANTKRTNTSSCDVCEIFKDLMPPGETRNWLADLSRKVIRLPDAMQHHHVDDDIIQRLSGWIDEVSAGLEDARPRTRR